ncbi:chemotaxis protein CheA [Peredibacter starrii]|uniref:Chemotaxis protein CheA n=1 Tax=Peredibacter starrii TaxID=28202 RepID=A0AAX4HPP1_9BACT|nr:chemotaxis protein CheA [Peredibacter starrii]WPU65082.1 chemotaxis protein CheA [Peredibacter starrii]
MTIDDDGFLEELRQEFLAEACSLLEQWEEYFLKLEETDDKAEQVTNIFRVAHCLKGTSSAVGYSEMAAFAHIVEDLLQILKKDPSCLTPEIVTTLLKCGDAFKVKVAFLMGKEKTDWDVTVLAFDINNYLISFGHAGHDTHAAPAEDQNLMPAGPSEETKAESIESDDDWKQVMADVNQKFGVQLTEEHMHLSEDEIAKVIADQQSEKAQKPAAPVIQLEQVREHKEEEKKAAAASASAPKDAASSKAANATVKVDAHKIDKIMNLVGELVINKSQLANRVEQYRDDHVLEATYSLLEKTIRELQDETLGMRMISMKNLFLKCQRAVRDVSIKLNKNIEFVQSGEDVEIDRSMVELLTDPLLHMLRNSVDHGIESQGTILLKAEHVGSKIILSIKDNGRGINAEKVFGKAMQNGLISPSVKMSDLTENEIFQFIMMPGFSTAEKITDVSGRGVGLDVVKTTVEKMNGKVDISSQLGKGTCFKLILPLTTSIQEGIHVKSNNSSYIFPTEKVLEILSGDKVSFITDPNGLNMFKYRETVIPYATLDATLGLSPDFKISKMILIMDVDGKNFGIGIDEFVAQVHVVLKPINEIVRTSTGISASCILSHGGIGFVIDTDEVCKSVLKNNKEQNRLAA